MATYDRGYHILPSVASVLGQTHSDLELIVIGDGCTDDTGQLVLGLLDPRVSWVNLSSRSGSQSGPNNEGIERSKADLIAYLGHDDIWTPDHIERILDVFEAQEADFAISGAVYHLPEGVDRPHVTGLFRDGEDLASTHFFPPSSFAHKKHAVTKMGGWNDPQQIKAPVDHDLLLRAAAQNLKFRSTNHITVHKFAAGHRYLSYLSHSSNEQTEMLNRVRGSDHQAYSDGLIDLSRRNGHYMIFRHPSFEAYAEGQLARENAERKGNLRPPLVPLGSGQVMLQITGEFALDWKREPEFGVRWSSVNPKPKLLIPFTSSDPVLALFSLVCLDRIGLMNLKLEPGNAILHSLSEPEFCDGKWEAVAVVDLRLSDADYTILQFDLGSHFADVASPLGIAEIVVGPRSKLAQLISMSAGAKAERQNSIKQNASKSGTSYHEIEVEMDRLRQEIVALRQSTSWRATALPRLVMNWLRR